MRRLSKACFVLWFYIFCASCLAFSIEVKIEVTDLQQNVTLAPIAALPAMFGPEVGHAYTVTGLLQLAEPEEACSGVNNTPSGEVNMILLIRRSDQDLQCHFIDKVRNAQKAGASAALVYDNLDEQKVVMAKPPYIAEVGIPSAFMSREDGLALRDLLLAGSPSPEGPRKIMVVMSPTHHHVGWRPMLSSSFIAIVCQALSVVLATFFYARQSHAVAAQAVGAGPLGSGSLISSLSPAQVKAIHTVEYSGPSQEGEADLCTVCLEEFLKGHTLRDLPCSHKFHVACIDEWLMRKSTCPVCKFDLADCFRAPNSRPQSVTESLEQPLLSPEQQSTANLSDAEARASAPQSNTCPRQQEVSIQIDPPFTTTSPQRGELSSSSEEEEITEAEPGGSRSAPSSLLRNEHVSIVS